MRRLIYVCAPYSDNPKEHTKAARSYCRKVYGCGYIPLAPSLHFPQFLDDSKPKERRDGLQMATELLRRCNSLLICGDRISEGNDDGNPVGKAARHDGHDAGWLPDCAENAATNRSRDMTSAQTRHPPALYTRAAFEQFKSLPTSAKVNHAIARIRTWYEHCEGAVSVSFSGGKDKYVTVCTPGMDRAVRLTSKSLGVDYTPENIAKRIFSMPYIATEPNRSSRSGHSSLGVHSNRSKHIRLNGNRKPVKLKGLRALYFRYMYELGFIKKRLSRIHMSKERRAEIRKLDAYAARMRTLNDHRIETMEQLVVHRKTTRNDIISLTRQRTQLHRKKEGADDPIRHNLAEQTDAITKRLRKLRTEIKLCDAIEGEREAIPVRLDQIKRTKEDSAMIQQNRHALVSKTATDEHLPSHRRDAGPDR